MRMRFVLPILLGLLSGCAGFDPAQEGPCGLSLLTTVPVTMVRGAPLVSVTIAGQNTTLILDTGAQKTLLTDATVRRLNLRTDPRMPMTVRGIGGTSRNWPAILTGVAVSGVPVPDQYALVLPFDLPSVDGRQIDGLLGVDVLGAYEVDLDLPEQRVGLYGGRACPAEVLPGPGPMVEMESAALRRNRLVVPVVLNGQKVNALFDSGSASSIAMLHAVLRGGITREELARDPVVSLRGAGPALAAAWVHQFQTLAIASEIFRNPMLRVTERPAQGTSFVFASDSDDDDMIIGTDYLSHRRVWLAYPRQKVFLQAPPR